MGSPAAKECRLSFPENRIRTKCYDWYRLQSGQNPGQEGLDGIKEDWFTCEIFASKSIFLNQSASSPEQFLKVHLSLPRKVEEKKAGGNHRGTRNRSDRKPAGNQGNGVRRFDHTAESVIAYPNDSWEVAVRTASQKLKGWFQVSTPSDTPITN